MSKKNGLQGQLEAIQGQLKSISNQLDGNRELMGKFNEILMDFIVKYGEINEAYRSFGIALGLLVGLAGNFFVVLWFQEWNKSTVWGLWLFGGLILGAFLAELTQFILTQVKLRKKP